MEFELHVVDTDVFVFLSIDDMGRHGIFFNNLKNRLVQAKSKETAVIKRIGGHHFLRWSEQMQSHFTYTELHHLRRRFGHPNVDKLYNLLKRSGMQDVDANTRKMLERIEQLCLPCQTYVQPPRRFKFTLRDNIDFNHTVSADIFHIDGRPFFHVIDEAASFQAATWLSDVSAGFLWHALRQC